MKKLVVMGMLLAGIAGIAQVKNDRAMKRAEMEKMTSEQRDQLRMKKLTLDLNLNDSQQKEISMILKEESAKREVAMSERKIKREKEMKVRADERYERSNKMLDEKIVMKSKMKKILTAEQFVKWESQMDRKNEKRAEHKMKRKSMKKNARE